MVRVLIVLFWVCLIVGTYVTGNVLGNWVVCLLALFFFIRSRRQKRNALTQPVGPPSAARPQPGSLTAAAPGTPPGSTVAPRRPSQVASAHRRWR